MRYGCDLCAPDSRLNASPRLRLDRASAIGAILRSPLGIVRRYFGRGAHLWLYDFAAMRMLMERVGFVAIRECALGASNDPCVAQVEEAGRFFTGAERELAIEARKPAQVAFSRQTCGSP